MLAYLWSHQAVLGVPALIFVATLATLKGGPAERTAALVFLGANLGITILDALSDSRELIANLSLAGDGLLAALFLLLAMRYSNLWLAVAMIAQGAAFAFHAYLLENQDDGLAQSTYANYALGMAFMTWIVMAVILGGALATWRKRVIARRGITAAAPPPSAHQPIAG